MSEEEQEKCKSLAVFTRKIPKERDYRDNLPINGKDNNERNFRKIDYELTDELEFSENGDG
jgi:hypothetical protein